MNARGTSLGTLGYYALLYLPLAAVAFYLTYFSVMGEQPALTHLHFVVMLLWLGLSIAQPLLIRYGHRSLHRRVGALSYVVLPMVVVTGYSMLRAGALRELNSLRAHVGAGGLSLSDAEILEQVYDYALLGTPYIVWPALFYALAMVNRRQMIFHSRYMLAAILTVTGPIIDRIFFISLGLATIGPLPAEIISFFIIDMVLLAVLVNDHRQGHPTRPLIVSLVVYLIGQAGYFLLQSTVLWYLLAEVWLQLS